MPDMVSYEVKARRWDILNQELHASIQRRAQMMIGREDEIFVTKVTDKYISGRTANFKEVFVSHQEGVVLGDILPIRITENDGWVLRGEAR